MYAGLAVAVFEERLPDRITDQLKRITREQGGVATPASGPRPGREPGAKRYGPLIALAVVVVLAAVGWMMIERLMAMSRMQDCVMSGRKNCAPLDTEK
jgi:hypothetical protein